VNLDKIILLVGLMGSGKTSVGKRLSQKLNLSFVDGDKEVEAAAGLPISEIFKCFGEEEFRNGEKRVMKRLLNGESCVLASGGGSFVPDEVRDLAKKNAITIWLKADIDVLQKRTTGRSHRPLLNVAEDEIREKLEKYINLEYPFYSDADIIVETHDEDVENTVKRVYDAIVEYKEKI